MSKTLPPSATDLGTSLLGLGTGLLMLAILRHTAPDIDPLLGAVFIMAATALPPVLGDLIYFRRYRETPAQLNAKRTVRWSEIALKCYGLLVTWAFFALLYLIIPEYQGSFYHRYYVALQIALPLFFALSPLYFYWCARRSPTAKDGYDEFGRLALLQIKNRDWPEIGRHLRNWLVKAFFLPLMISYTIDSVNALLHIDTAQIDSLASIYALSERLIYFADLLFAAIGYILTFRILNTHIRSSEPTFRGWVVALACYAPFWQGLLSGHYFAYDDPIDWQQWLAGNQLFYFLWGYIILLLTGIYSFATVCLGIRFSNLTYRGLITSGPYRFCKHPAYVAKNLTWWMISVPFLSNEGPATAAAHCLLLGGLNLIYYLRARTEELHLSNYPEYVDYALAMNERSIFRPLTKPFPFLKYKAPAHPPKI